MGLPNMGGVTFWEQGVFFLKIQFCREGQGVILLIPPPVHFPGRGGGSVFMFSGRILQIIVAGIVVLCLFLATRIYGLYQEAGRKNQIILRLSQGIQERDRVLREFSAQVEGSALDPRPFGGQLSRNKSKIYSLKVKLRNKEMEMQKLRDELTQREGEIIGLRELISKRDKKMRFLRGEVRYQEKSVEGLKGVNREIARKLSRFLIFEKEVSEKEREIAGLKKKNAGLTESVSRMRRSAELLQQQLRQASARKKGGKPRN